MIEQDKIMQFLRTVGPTIPSKVAKSIGSDILIASAHLSDLASQGKVKISDLKVGGTPLYYLPGQEAQLYRFAASNLNPKDYLVAERLQQQSILQEAGLDLLSKVALRTIKDFAIPIHVTVNDQKELFWKWYLLSEEQTNAALTALLSPPEQELQKQAKEVEQQFPEQQQLEQASPMAMPQQESVTIIAPQSEEQQQRLTTEPQSIMEERKPKRRMARTPKKMVADEFFPLIEEFCKHHRIEIEEKETIRKNAEMNFKVRVPSVVGKTVYFCKAKNKMRCDDKDISAAYMEAQRKRLPLLFLYTGEIHKKVQEMLDAGTFENTVFRKLDGR